jgi:Xaa-Pro aminopeptidase
MTAARIQHEKLEQAVGILAEHDVDAWLTFVRETSHNADPALDLILGIDVTWHSAFLVLRGGERVAIVGRYEVDNVRLAGGWGEVIGYDESVGPVLLDVLRRHAPRRIAINWSDSDSSADGLSHGMYRALTRYLEGTPYELVSAEMVLGALRGRKTPLEIERLRAAVRVTEQVIDDVTATLRPGMTEREIAQRTHETMARLGVTPSWDRQFCPTVNCGPDSPVGHVMPGDLAAQPGHVVHLDLGVALDDYTSDMQRVWYLPREGERGVPREVQRAFDAVRAAIEAAAETLRPGVQGWQVDTASRDSLVAAGYPEYKHAVGHGVGRTVHDGATLLGPRWERYGNAPMGIVEAGNVFTLELGAHVAEHGIVSLEEEVLVTDDGLEWLGAPQTEVILVGE